MERKTHPDVWAKLQLVGLVFSRTADSKHSAFLYGTTAKLRFGSLLHYADKHGYCTLISKMANTSRKLASCGSFVVRETLLQPIHTFNVKYSTGFLNIILDNHTSPHGNLN